MKHWYRSMPARAVCFFLCILSLAVTAGCAAGGVFMVENGFYGAPEGYLIEDYIYNYVWNDAYSVTYHVLRETYEEGPEDFVYYVDYAYGPEVTNLRFTLFGEGGQELGSNLPEGETVEWRYAFRYYYQETNGRLELERVGEGEDDPVCTLRVGFDEEDPVQDKYATTRTLIHVAYVLRYWIYLIGVLAMLMAVVCYLILVCVAGKRPGEDGFFPGPLYRVPFDLLLALSVLAFMLLFSLIIDGCAGEDMWTAVLLFGASILGVAAFLGLSMSAAARIRQRTLLKGSLIFLTGKLFFRLMKVLWRWIHRGGRGFVSLCGKIPMLWRTLVVIAVSVVVDLFVVVLAADGFDGTLLLWILKNLVFAAVLLYLAWFMQRLKRGGDALAAGDLAYQVDTAGMVGDLKRHGRNLNSIADGMSHAVEERLKSERMRSELIANVSHDIKTPLTSIINYAGLIAEESCDSENHRAYAEVLLRKSERLKRLLEDLVEASRAATGNLDMELVPCEAGVLLTQTVGEFEEKCKQSELELIATQPEDALWILADSRRIWRVFENLMNNACKYSLPGSRVYVNLLAVEGEVLFVFRNTSRAVLNVSAEELTERFVRGDASRSTEGNGLGLSIARSLTERQGGKMEIITDGDLFKVTLRFPLL